MMTLSCRAQAFSVDNLLKPSPPTNTQKSKTQESLDAETPPSPSSPPLFYQKPSLHPETSSEFLRSQLKILKRENEDSGDDSPLDNSSKMPFNQIEYKFNLSKAHTRLNHCVKDYSFICDTDRKVEILSESDDFKEPQLLDENQRAILDSERVYLSSFPYLKSTVEVDKEQKKCEKHVANRNLEQSSESSHLTSSCFCHGEISFCHHPGILSVSDTYGTERSVIVELCHADLWSSFHRLGTEMIITKSGRRMFPALKVRISGLMPDKLYTVKLEFLQPDSRKYRYIYHSSRWMVSGSGDALATPPCHRTPEGPISGQAICSQILSFERLKLTNTETPKSGQVSLVSMQKFQPQVVVEEVKSNESDDVSHTERYVIMFPQTSFMAVTAYQNQQITTLKIASNPFAKGFRDSGKTRIPYETFMSPLPNFLPCGNSSADYVPGILTSQMWPAIFRQERITLANGKRCLEAVSDKLAKIKKVDDDNTSATTLREARSQNFIDPPSMLTTFHQPFITPHHLMQRNHSQRYYHEHHQHHQQQQQEQLQHQHHLFQHQEQLVLPSANKGLLSPQCPPSYYTVISAKHSPSSGTPALHAAHPHSLHSTSHSMGLRQPLQISPAPPPAHVQFHSTPDTISKQHMCLSKTPPSNIPSCDLAKYPSALYIDADGFCNRQQRHCIPNSQLGKEPLEVEALNQQRIPGRCVNLYDNGTDDSSTEVPKYQSQLQKRCIYDTCAEKPSPESGHLSHMTKVSVAGYVDSIDYSGSKSLDCSPTSQPQHRPPPPRCMTEPVRLGKNGLCHCLGCNVQISRYNGVPVG